MKTAKSENYKYFKNDKCEYFPCHKMEDEDFFNCLFCYCPLYALGEDCGGNFTWSEKGIKNCSACNIPHGRKGYEHISSKIGEVIKRTSYNRS